MSFRMTKWKQNLILQVMNLEKTLPKGGKSNSIIDRWVNWENNERVWCIDSKNI